MTGHGDGDITMERLWSILRKMMSLTSCQIGRLRPWPNGCRPTPVLKSLPETVLVLMQMDATEARHQLFR
ncbi:hypothetical protein BGC31_02585 [Komagataeibacter xylinus]|nr:hypothetical protein GLUCORHAEAF1_07870 [Komagataeibacter rhaeticus AF1]RFP06046.1 hypothetical protein BGC31_02585 [Komagataeibacter xylinus]